MSGEKRGGLGLNFSLGLALGAPFCIVFGSLFDNLLLGIGPGIAIGMVLAHIYDLQEGERKVDDEK